MSIADHSFDAAVDRIEQLSVAYGEFTVEERGGTLPDGEYDRLVSRYEEGDPIGGVSVWVRNDEGAVLLVQPEGEDAWADPAGDRQPGESYTEAARRVVSDETGIECEITGVHHADLFELSAEDESRPPVVRLDVVFEAEHRAGTASARGSRIDAVEWWATLPAQLLYPDLSQLPVPEA